MSLLLTRMLFYTSSSHPAHAGLHNIREHIFCLIPTSNDRKYISHISPTERLFVLKTLSRTQRATKVKIFVGIFLKRLRLRVMPQNMSEKANMLIFRLTRCQLSPLDTQRRARGYPTIVNNIQPCPKLCLLMPLARVGARTESTTSYSYNARCGQLPRTRIGIVRRTRARYRIAGIFGSLA